MLSDKVSGHIYRTYDKPAEILRHWICSEDVINVCRYQNLYNEIDLDRKLIVDEIGEYAESLLYKFHITKGDKIAQFMTERNTDLILVACASLLSKKCRNFELLDKIAQVMPRHISEDIQFYIMDTH